MPKGNKSKKKKEKHQEDEGATVQSGLVQDEDSESVCSSLPDSTVSDEVQVEDDSDSTSDLQFQLSEHIDQLLDKNAKVRTAALKGLNELLKRRMVAHLLDGREETVTDILTKGIKRSRGDERCGLMVMARLFALQFGEEVHSLYTLLQPLLLAIIRDHTLSPVERSTALSTSVFLCFILCQDIKDVQEVMQECEAVMHRVRVEPIAISAVKGWSLLLSIVPNHVIPALISSQLPHLTQLLDKSADLSVKVVTGQAISLLLEIARETDENLLDTDEVENACDIIQAISSDSNRHTGRKERSQQRSSFKEFVSTVKTGEAPDKHIKLGTETLQLDSWARQVQYSAITDILGTGTANHLQTNEVLRDIFQLGAPPVVGGAREKRAGKIERKMYNAACAKYRSQSRGKQRDKRSVM